MSGEKKLFRVTVEFEFYAYAEDEHDAVELAQDAMDDMDVDDCASAREVKTQPRFLGHHWTRDSLVYHADSEDIELGTLLDRLPKETK